MQTPAEQREFFAAESPELRRLANAGDAAHVVAFVRSFEDPLQRRVLWLYARQTLVMDPECQADLDLYVEVMRAGIADLLAEAAEEGDAETAARRTDLANIASYNLSADLADCWPADGKERQARHFEAGLAAALDCIRWRQELNKPAGPHSMAWWARGMHELSLGRTQDAVTSFERSLQYAREANEDEAAFGVILGRGYLALARRLTGDEAASAEWDAAVALFTEQAEGSGVDAAQERASEAKFGLEQLRTVEARYSPGLRPGQG